MDVAKRAQAVAVLGGTFNPVHFGHLRSALELVDHLHLSQLRLMVSARPPHRDEPQTSAEPRAAMVQLAVDDEPRLICDTRELARSGPSYTVDSLKALRAEVGQEMPLLLGVGGDAVQGLTGWSRWQALLDYAHLVVVARPGFTLPRGGELGDWLTSHEAGLPGDLFDVPQGRVYLESLRPLPISATEIRALLQSGKSARYLLPDSVLDYINQHELYTGRSPTT